MRPIEATSPIDNRNLIFTDILSYAITGELIGMANYAAIQSVLGTGGTSR